MVSISSESSTTVATFEEQTCLPTLTRRTVPFRKSCVKRVPPDPFTCSQTYLEYLEFVRTPRGAHTTLECTQNHITRTHTHTHPGPVSHTHTHTHTPWTSITHTHTHPGNHTEDFAQNFEATLQKCAMRDLRKWKHLEAKNKEIASSR